MRRLGGSLALPAPIRDFIRKPLDPHPAVPVTLPGGRRMIAAQQFPDPRSRRSTPAFHQPRAKLPPSPTHGLALPASIRPFFRKPLDSKNAQGPDGDPPKPTDRAIDKLAGGGYVEFRSRAPLPWTPAPRCFFSCFGSTHQHLRDSPHAPSGRRPFARGLRGRFRP